jgi:phosphoribosyl 1,2-cyclic phosphodiesterase
LRAIGSAPENIDAIFITHEHRDHVSGAEVFCARYGTPIHIIAPCFENTACAADFIVHPPIFEEILNDIVVKSFVTLHDSMGSVGYIIERRGGGVKLGLVTDLGVVTQSVAEALLGCNAAVIESNYDEEMLRYGEYPLELKHRISSHIGHLGNRECAELAALLAAYGTTDIMLAHISHENNTQAKALAATTEELARRGLDARVSVAGRDSATLFYERNEV